MGVYSVLLSVFFAAAFVAVGNSVRVTAGARHGRRSRSAWCCSPRRSCCCCANGPCSRIGSADAGGAGAGLSLAAALRTPAFWVFGGATSLFGLVSSGLGLFNEAVLAERGFNQQTYVTFLAATSMIALVGQLACGWLTLHWSMQRLLGLAMFIYAAALAALPLLTTLPQLWIFAALIGLSGGMITVIFFAVWRQAFGVGAPGPHTGRRADADGAGVGDRTAVVRAVRGADRVVHARALDAGAVRLACSSSRRFGCGCPARTLYPDATTRRGPPWRVSDAFSRSTMVACVLAAGALRGRLAGRTARHRFGRRSGVADRRGAAVRRAHAQRDDGRLVHGRGPRETATPRRIATRSPASRRSATTCGGSTPRWTAAASTAPSRSSCRCGSIGDTPMIMMTDTSLPGHRHVHRARVLLRRSLRRHVAARRRRRPHVGTHREKAGELTTKT